MNNFNQPAVTSFWDTINLSSEKLREANEKALDQETIISAIYENNPKLPINPTAINKILSEKFNMHIPLTSVRRAITNLTTGSEKLGRIAVLLKTSIKAPGSFQYDEHCWIWKGGNENIEIEKAMPGKTISEFAEALSPNLKQGKLL